MHKWSSNSDSHWIMTMFYFQVQFDEDSKTLKFYMQTNSKRFRDEENFFP